MQLLTGIRNGTESSKTATDRDRDKDHDDVNDIDDSGGDDDDDVVVVVGGGGAGVVVDDDDDTSVAELPVGGLLHCWQLLRWSSFCDLIYI
jgi:hypothetical protein